MSQLGKVKAILDNRKMKTQNVLNNDSRDSTFLLLLLFFLLFCFVFVLLLLLLQIKCLTHATMNGLTKDRYRAAPDVLLINVLISSAYEEAIND